MATLQAPPNSTGTVIDGITQGANFRQTVNQGDPTIVGNATYRATYKNLSVGTAATTNIATIAGSATKTVKVTSIKISGTIATTAENYDAQVNRQSAADTGGTATTAATIDLNDTNNGAATAAAPKFYTAAPTAGTLVAAICSRKIFFPVAPAEAQQYELLPQAAPGKQGITLRGTSDVLAVTLNGATPAHASSVDIEFEWTEE